MSPVNPRYRYSTEPEEEQQTPKWRFPPVSPKLIIALTVVAICLVIVIASFNGIVGHNDYQTFQIKQSMFGQVEVVSTPGYYMKNFARVWTYPQAYQRFWTKNEIVDKSPEDESFKVTFTDGGNADISTLIMIRLPSDNDHRMMIHRMFGGSMDGLMNAVRAHMINCGKATASTMSSSEHQSARKAEFAQIIQDQLIQGLYEMKKIAKVVQDVTDEKGKPITVYATEIVRDEKTGKPIVSSLSPLAEYGVEVIQFSVTDTDYDAITLKQFEAKKQSFLLAEQSKAQRQQEVEQRLMIEAQGLRQKAEVEAKANMEKAQATINATKEKEVAETNAQKDKTVAETQAAKLVQVALLEKQEAETRAAKELEVAKLQRAAAEENAAKIKALATAEKERITIAGAITEEKKVLAEIKRDRDIAVAAELAKIQTPSVIMIGGASTGGGSSLTDNLMNYKLLQTTGILDDNKVQTVVTQ